MTGLWYNGEYLMDKDDVARVKAEAKESGFQAFSHHEHGRASVLIASQTGEQLAVIQTPWWAEEDQVTVGSFNDGLPF